ncbi:MAG: hypothetical protein D8H97_08565 [Neisseria sp.]|uniref:hypothetical protein n=1 Tax=Neisseria sicca TaxID=490 RepID=UPI000D30103E|nr:hypothetical protein [Neisseria sicca]RKV83231.1 MAG: hypothetical protein D8H97_08565 [Neisseria sp.]
MLNFFRKSEKVENTTKIFKLSDININENVGINKLKELNKILIIDDNDFPPLNKLRNNNFQITKFDDISSIQIVKEFPIVVCDIQGVGKELSDSTRGGAFIIKEIRNQYPDKYIIAYSTHSYDLVLQEYTKHADIFIGKGTSVEQWSSIFEEAIRICSNPIIRWKRFRSILLEKNMELYELFQLEQKYIQYLVEQKNKDTILDETKSISINPYFQDIVNQFISSSLSSGLIEIAKEVIK